MDQSMDHPLLDPRLERSPTAIADSQPRTHERQSLAQPHLQPAIPVVISPTTPSVQPYTQQQPTPAYTHECTQQQQATTTTTPIFFSPEVHQPQPYATPVVLPTNAQPSHYLTMTVVVTVICGFLNISSLLFGIPAVLAAIAGSRSYHLKQFAATKILGYLALSLTISNVVYTTLIDMAIIFVATYASCRIKKADYHHEYHYYYDYHHHSFNC